MPQKGRHAVLEARLEALAARIEELKGKLSRAKGIERVEEAGEIEELTNRHKTLRDRLQELDREGAGFPQDAKAELQTMADDLTTAVEDFMAWADSGFSDRRKPQKR